MGVAAAIGFEGSLGGLTEGLTTLASGPDSSQAAEGADAAGADPIDSAISALASPTGPGFGPGGGAPGGGGGTGTGESPGGGGGSPGGSPGGPGGPGGPTGDGDVNVDPPDVTAPNDNPVGEIVDGLGDGVGGLLGG